MRFAWLAIALGLALGSPAFAQEARRTPSAAEGAEARRQFDLGTADYHAGRYPDALERFRRSYDLTGSDDILYNIATVLELLRRDEEALEHYERYLLAVPNAEDRPRIEARMQVLR